MFQPGSSPPRTVFLLGFSPFPARRQSVGSIDGGEKKPFCPSVLRRFFALSVSFSDPPPFSLRTCNRPWNYPNRVFEFLCPLPFGTSSACTHGFHPLPPFHLSATPFFPAANAGVVHRKKLFFFFVHLINPGFSNSTSDPWTENGRS